MIDIRQLSFKYRPNKVVYKDLNFNLEVGRIYGLLGKNGTGKSTLLRNLSGLAFPTSGRVVVNGYEPCKRETEFLQDLYFVTDKLYLPSITAKKFVELHAPFYPKFDHDFYYKSLQEWEVDAEQKIDKMSLGQQRKTMICFGLACQTKVVLMDEPTDGLDIPSKAQFRKMIAAAMTDDRLFIISTHQVRDLESLIDGIIIMQQQKVVLQATLEHISEKLIFKTITGNVPDNAIYAEDAVRGKAIVVPNTENEFTKVNLEQLFTASLSNPEVLQNIFKN